MENLLKILSLLNNNQINKPEHNDDNNKDQNNSIPKEVLEQYPYGEFPSRYTKSGQENIRKNSENRYSYNKSPQQEHTHKEDCSKCNNSSDLNISSLLPLIQLMSGKKQSNDMMKLFSEILFKDNKDMQQLFKLISNQKPQEIKNDIPFPDTNKVNISSLRKINE